MPIRTIRAAFLAFTLSAITIGFGPEDLAPLLLILVVCSAARPWLEAWSAARGTSLRPALVWAALALACLALANVLALREPLATGRPVAGQLTYLAVLAFLAALISVLNARTPGERVWAGLMVLLVVVFLIPWLEMPGRVRRAAGLASLHLDAPCTLFYLILVIVGATNYLPTRFGAAALCLTAGFITEYLGLTRSDWAPERRAMLWCWVAWTFTASLWIARFCATRGPPARVRLERQWFWFRDAWGVVWALRISERFNRSAALAQWPIRLGWFGLGIAEAQEEQKAPAVPVEAETAFRGLLRRFVRPWRLEEV
jgi:hypothetical protein